MLVNVLLMTENINLEVEKWDGVSPGSAFLVERGFVDYRILLLEKMFKITRLMPPLFYR